MGNCLQYICPSSHELKKQEVSVNADKEEQRAAETKTDKPEFPCEKIGRSASCPLPSIDVDLPVLTLGRECKSQAKNADKNVVENKDKEKTETTDGAQNSVGLQRFFFQSSSDSSLQTCDGTKTEDPRKALALPTPKQMYRKAGALKDKETENICNKAEEKRKTSMRKKLHLPKIKMKPRRKSQKFVPFDEWITGRLALMPRGVDEECDFSLKPLDVVHSQMPSRALKDDDIFLAVHQNAPNNQDSSSDEGLEKQEKEEVMASSLPPSLQLPSWNEMYRRLIKKKEMAANEHVHVETPQKLTREENGGKLRTRRKRKMSRAHRKRPVRTVDEEDMASDLPFFIGCDMLESTQAVLFEVEDAGYLASGEESD